MERFRLTEDFLKGFKERKPPFGFEGLGELVYMRTYSRIKPDGQNERWWETVQRVVEGTYNMQKTHIELNGLGWNPQKAQASAQEMYDRMYNMLFLPPGRGLWAMGSVITEDRGCFAALNNPLHEDTLVLTKEHGWCKLGTVEGQNITVLSNTKLYGRDNATAANAVWVPARVSEIEMHPCVELTYQSKGGDSYTVIASENHRWFRKLNTRDHWTRITTLDLNVGDWLPRTKQPKCYPICPEGIQHGFFWGDGTRLNGELHVFDADKQAVIRELFTRVDYVTPEHMVVRHCPLAWGHAPSGLYRTDQRYSYGFLAGYFAADGSITPNGRMRLSSANMEALQTAKVMFDSLGIRTGEIRLSSESSNLKQDRKLYDMTIEMQDLTAEFFLRPGHKEIYASCPKMNNDWLKITDIKKLPGLHRVLCATVPDYEQFVIEGWCLTSNCGLVSTKDIASEPTKPFCFLMDASMLGVGVGFDTLGAGLLSIRQPRQAGDEMIIPDSREGWVESVKRLLNSYFKAGPSVTFDYSEIRPAGELIKGFGGVASGPEPLEKLHCDIRELLDASIGKQITKRIIVDLMNLIGKCVVAGNVRRTAEIAIDFGLDPVYLELKDYDKNPDRAGHGWASNNTVNVELGSDYTLPASYTQKNGEPGYIWLENMRGYSRMGCAPDNKDQKADGSNPCVEQTLESFELCNLVETFPHRHKSLADYKRTLKFAYLYAKTVTLGKTHWPETNRILLRNRRIGCSMSGIAQFIGTRGIHTLRQWCREGYSTVQYYDDVYSDWLCIPRSIKVTSIKPSGTVSLLAGATPGMHYPESRWYIRRMRLDNKSALVAPLKAAGYNVEPCVGQETSTVVVEIPVAIAEDIRTVKDVTMWEQLALAAMLQHDWADNQVSCTITFEPETEGKEIGNALNFYQYQLKGVSFLPKLQKGTFAQMPYEAITEERYLEMKAQITLLDFDNVEQERAEVERFCDGDKCTL